MLVQCKRWDSRPIGVDEIRKLAGTLMREGLPGKSGMLVTSSHFSLAARAEAGAIGLELVEGRDLLRRLEEGGAVDLLAVDRALKHTHVCPHCAEPMVLDRSPHGWWLRCPNYSKGCHGKRDLGTDGRKALEYLLTSG